MDLYVSVLNPPSAPSSIVYCLSPRPTAVETPMAHHSKKQNYPYRASVPQQTGYPFRLLVVQARGPRPTLQGPFGCKDDADSHEEGTCTEVWT